MNPPARRRPCTRPIRPPAWGSGCATPGWSSTSGTSAPATRCPTTSTASTGWSCSAARSRRLDDAEASPELVGVRAAAGPGARRRRPDAGDLPRRPAARPGRRRPGAARASTGPEVGATPGRQARRRRRRPGLRPAAAVAGRAPVAPRRDLRSCPPAPPCWPATRATRTRPSAWAGTSTGCSSTSRRRRRSSASGPSSDAVGVAASPHDARDDLPARPTPRTPTSPRPGRRSPAGSPTWSAPRARQAA